MNTDTSSMVALVSGANRGLGLEVVRQLARLGYNVALGSRDVAKGVAAAETLKKEGLDVTVVELDVTDDRSVEEAVEKTVEHFGRLDVLVNNAGINYDTYHRAATAYLDDVHETFETNFFGAWRLAMAAIPHLRKSGRGRIVNVSSGAGMLHDMGEGTPGYSTSKAALNALTCILANELRRDRILVNSVCPGWTDTDMGGGGRPVAEGADGIVWAATLPDDGPTGGFFRDKAKLPW
jgi:NAD(P)-dependent dehydrogenase (short-subunit alcohol dehydrogenase family)